MPEPLILLLMAGVFVALAVVLRIPLGPSLALAALAGALAGGHGFAVRHLVEGAFGFFDIILIIASAMIFMKVLQKSGLLDALVAGILRTFHRRPLALLWTAMALLMLPGMITGSSLAAVLSTGPLVAPVLLKLGLAPPKTAAFIASGAILGMIAPPVNIPVMIIGAGVDMPYVGLTLPLLIIVVPLAIAIPPLFGGRNIRSLNDEDRRALLPPTATEGRRPRIYTPLFLVLILLILQNVGVRGVSSLGLPATFFIGSLAGSLSGKRFNFGRATQEAVTEALPILSLLVGVGMFIQVMTLTGGRGWAVLSILSLPTPLLGVGIAVGLPLFGGISSFGAASVLGIPFLLALPARNALINAAALSAVVAVGDLIPPAAAAARFSAQIAGEKSLARVLRRCLVPALLILAMGLGLLVLGPRLEALF